jgi:hypothetical protein
MFGQSTNENISDRINENHPDQGNYGRHSRQRWSQRQKRTSRQHERLKARAACGYPEAALKDSEWTLASTCEVKPMR